MVSLLEWVKSKSENKSATNEYRYFIEWNLVGVNRLFVFVSSNEDADSKKFKTKRYTYQNA